MPRKRRIVREGFCYHIMLRGNGGQNIFKDDADRVRFCLLLQYAVEKHKLKVHGFCFMDNHVHLLMQPMTSNLSSGLHVLAFRYAQHFNRKYKQCGYLYQGRYKAVIVQNGSYLTRLMRYIHLNPVRANLVKCPEDYKWSSHQAYTEQTDHTWLCQDLVLRSFGEATTEGREKFLEYVQITDDKKKDELFEIRKSLKIGAYGDEIFMETLRKELNQEEASNGYSFGMDAVSLETIIESVCCNQNVSLDEIQSDKRDKKLVQARAAMALLTTKLRVSSLGALGRKILRDPTSLAKLAKKAKNDPDIVVLCQEISVHLAAKKVY